MMATLTSIFLYIPITHKHHKIFHQFASIVLDEPLWKKQGPNPNHYMPQILYNNASSQ